MDKNIDEGNLWPYDSVLREYNKFINDKYYDTTGLSEDDIEEFKENIYLTLGKSVEEK
tara:strand:- start:54 stop:227 length:174 start_codon:yes stop_codon:yes gene_type:complete